MTYDEIVEMLEEMSVPLAYDHFAEGESPAPPFICFLYPETETFPADDVVYYKADKLNIELYTDIKDPVLEEKLENILTEYSLFFDRSETWISSEHLYEVLYTVTV